MAQRLRAYEPLPGRLTVRGFLRQARQRPFIWGEFDCCLFAADWVLAQTGFDPAEQWRGTYDTEDGAAAIMAEAGGMAALLDQVMERSDCPMVGVLRLPEGQTCAVAAGGMWAVLTPPRDEGGFAGSGMLRADGIGFSCLP